MNIISLDNFLLMLITQAIHALAQMQHTNDQISIVKCKGNDVDMLWNVDEEESKISQLQLYFSNTIICYTSLVNGFIVSTSYQGRIERIDKTGFRLKNVSLDDEGYYTMFALIIWSTNQKMKKMILRILEPPTEKCTCNIQPDFKCELPASDCGRPTVSLVWKRKQTYEDLGGGNWTMNSTLQDEEILSCLDGEAMKCVNDSRQFCTNVSIPHQVTERSHEDKNTKQTDSVTVPGFSGTDIDSTAFNKFRDLHIGSLVGTLIIIIVAVSVSSAILYYRGKKFVKKSGTWPKSAKFIPLNDLDIEGDLQQLQQPNLQHKAYREDARPDTEEAVPMNDTETEIKFQTLQHTTLKRQAYREDASPDTEEIVPMNDTETEIKFQTLQHTKLKHKAYREDARPDTEEAVPMNDTETEIKFQTLQHTTLNPILDTGEAICMKDSNVENEYLRFRNATHQMMDLFNQIHEEYMTYTRNATGKSVPKNQCMSDSGTESELQKLQETDFWTWPDSADFIPMNQPINDLDTEGNLQKLQQSTLDPSHDTREAVTMKDSNAENNFQKLQKATHEMRILLTKILEEYMTYERNATRKSVPKNQCMSDSDTESEIQKLQETDFFLIIDTEDAISMNDLNTEREFQILQKVVLHIRSFLSQVPEEFITYKMPGKAEIGSLKIQQLHPAAICCH